METHTHTHTHTRKPPNHRRSIDPLIARKRRDRICHNSRVRWRREYRKSEQRERERERDNERNGG